MMDKIKQLRYYLKAIMSSGQVDQFYALFESSLKTVGDRLSSSFTFWNLKMKYGQDSNNMVKKSWVDDKKLNEKWNEVEWRKTVSLFSVDTLEIPVRSWAISINIGFSEKLKAWKCKFWNSSEIRVE